MGAAPSGGTADHWVVLTGCRKGSVRRALVDARPGPGGGGAGPPPTAVRAGQRGRRAVGPRRPLDSARNDALVPLADRAGAEIVATNNVHYHVPARRQLATALAAVRARRSLDDIDGWLPAAAAAHLRSGAEQARRFARYPGVVERAAALGRECAFDLALVAPQLAAVSQPRPDHTEMTWLRAPDRARARSTATAPASAPRHPRA